MKSSVFKVSIAIVIFLIVVLLFIISRDENQSGAIHVSQPKVWREDAVMLSKGRQIAELRNFREKLDLSSLQGEQSHEKQSSTSLNVAVKVPLANTTGAAPPATQAPKTTGATPASPAQTSGNGASEDPIDALQRVNDFNASFEGILLEHLRDSGSQMPGYSLYLLGFDVSVDPGPDTRIGYDGYLNFQISPEAGNAVQIYSVSPERYVERYSEVLKLSSKFQAALSAAAKGVQGSAGQTNSSSDEFSKLERYPIISGFINGPRSFGWMFHPRPTISRNGRKLEFALEPGIRHCYAFLLVRDGNITAPKWFFSVDPAKLWAMMQDLDDRSMSWFEGLDGVYRRLFAEVNGNDDPEEISFIKKQLYPQAFGFGADGPFQADILKERLAAQMKGIDRNALDGINLDKLDEELQELETAGKTSSPKYANVKKLKSLLGPFARLHKTMLGLVGRQGTPGAGGPVTSVKITVTGGWISNSGFFKSKRKGFVEPFTDEVSPPVQMEVSLPDRVDRTLESIWAVLPTHAPEGQETWVSIKGRGFTNDPKVYLGDRLATEIQVVSSEIILAKFPPYSFSDSNGQRKCFRVKVYSGGEAMTSPPDSFCYDRAPNGQLQASGTTP